MISKVTALIVREREHGEEIVVFRHPTAGVQLPAGTVEEGETIEDAAAREAWEETRLPALKIERFLGSREENPLPGRAVIARSTTLFSRPDPLSFDWARIPRGIHVAVEREREGYALVSYREEEQVDGSPLLSFQISGWAPRDTLTTRVTRYFFLLRCDADTPDAWSVHVDNHRFSMYWTRLQPAPHLHGYQNEWLTFLSARSS